MSLRTRAGGGGGSLPGLPAGGGAMPASTWPTRTAPLPPSSRGAPLLRLEHAYRPLALRDREQLAGARELSLSSRAPVGISWPLAAATNAHNWRPVPIDRGFRIPYNIPPTPGSAAANGGDSSSSSDSGKGGGCCG